jgi:hypothetical protein
MALPIEFCTVVFKKTQLAACFPGGLDAFFAFCDAPTYLEDDHLVRISFMATQEAHGLVERIASILPSEVAQAFDSAVVDRSTEPHNLPPWLMTGTIDDVQCAWMADVAPGALVNTPRSVGARFLRIPIARFRDELGALGILTENSSDAPDANFTLLRGTTRIDAVIGIDDGNLLGLITFLPNSRLPDLAEHEKLLVDLEAVLHQLGWTGHN